MTINGKPEDDPIRLGFPVADITAGIFAAFAIASSLHYRERSGKGKKVDVSVFHSMIALQTPRVAEFLATGKNPKRLERSSAFATPSQYFRTKDGYINVSAFSDRFWKKLCNALGLESMANDEAFSSSEKRMINANRLLPVLEKTFQNNKTSGWSKILESEGIPHGPIYTYEEMFDDNDLNFLEYLKEFDHPVAGEMKAMGLPIQTETTEQAPIIPPPLHGEHTEEVLSKLGFGIEEIDSLKKKRII